MDKKKPKFDFKKISKSQGTYGTDVVKTGAGMVETINEKGQKGVVYNQKELDKYGSPPSDKKAPAEKSVSGYKSAPVSMPFSDSAEILKGANQANKGILTAISGKSRRKK